MSDDNSPRGQRLALILVSIIVIFFFGIVFFPPQQVGFTLAIIRFLAATLAGWAGYLYTGNLNLEGKIPGSGLQIKAGGGFAAFILVFFLFYVGIPASSPPPVSNLFDKTTITSKIMNQVATTSEGYPIVATIKGNGASLLVNLDNVPSNIDSSKYKLVAFARVNGNPNWDSQGIKQLQKSPPPFELTLWHDPEKNAGDKRRYEAITIISSTFGDPASKTYTQDDVNRFAQKTIDTTTFYRDDSRVSVTP